MLRQWRETLFDMSKDILRCKIRMFKRERCAVFVSINKTNVTTSFVVCL
jgi:hypothetical protein